MGLNGRRSRDSSPGSPLLRPRPCARQAPRRVYTPRGGGGGGGAAQRHPPYAPPPSYPRAAGTGQRRGVFREIATTAAGVAVGTTVGHAVGHALTKGGSGQQQQQPQQQQQQPPPAGAAPPQQFQPQPQEEPCSFEVMQLLSCAQHEKDLNACVTFNDALRECLAQNNLAI